MAIGKPTPLTGPETMNTGFVAITVFPGPDTLRIKIQRPEREMMLALSQDECAQFAALLLRYLGGS